jgi:alpha-galactosidase
VALDAFFADAVLTLRVGDMDLLRATGDVLFADGTNARTVDATVERLDAGAVLRLRFHNNTAGAVHVEQLRLVAPNGLRNAALHDVHIHQTGWQSWSRSHPADVFEPNFETAGPPIRGPYLPHRRANSQVEPWMTILSVGDISLLIGFISAREQLGTIEIAPSGDGGHGVTIAVELDGIAVQPGQSIQSEEVLLAVGNPFDLLERYARITAERMRARKQSDVLTGWCSWYQLYTSVSEADVDRNVASLSAQRDRIPLKLIQIDDGYQRAIGDWLTLNEKFSSGMPALVERIKSAGYIPGLWLAPFLLSAHSQTFSRHPDWTVRDEHGDPLNAINNWGTANYALDTTHREAMEWLEHVIHTVCEEWGFEYLKLDFLYAAAMRGQRLDGHVTGNRAYRIGLERLREAAGERFILGCGAPLLPSIGLVDGMRIGSDVAAYWGDEGNADGPSLRNATRATLARLWMHGHWWSNDPDCVVIRASDTSLTLDEVQAWMSVVALSGGMVFIGDDVSRVEADRIEMLARLIPPSGRAATALPPLVHSIPERLVLHLSDSTVIGVANWTDVASARVLRLADFALPPAVYHVVDLWSGDYLGAVSDVLELGEVAPHGMRLLSLRTDRAAVVTRTGHLFGA